MPNPTCDMPLCRISFAVVVGVMMGLVALAAYTCCAQNSPKDYLDAHNAARAEVGVGPMAWDSVLAAYAENDAYKMMGDCHLKHSFGPSGQNLAAGSGLFTATEAVKLWVAEKAFYDYASNTCASGMVCGHYTQVVWRNSTHLGCARVQCNNGWWFVVCNYYPPGNYVGQRPYCSPLLSEYYTYEII